MTATAQLYQRLGPNVALWHVTVGHTESVVRSRLANHACPGFLLVFDTKLSALRIAEPRVAAVRPAAPLAQEEIIDLASCSAAA